VISRRSFLRGSGGLLVAISLPTACAKTGWGDPIPGTLTAYLDVSSDGSIMLYSPTSEMGQGTHTGHAAIIADELDVAIERVSVQTAEPADPFRRGKVMYSGGSYGISYWHRPLHKAAAQARSMLLTAAANELDVPVDDLHTDLGEVIQAVSGRRLSYGSLAAAAAALEPPEDPPLRNPDSYRYIGKLTSRIDNDAVVRGEEIFASDIERPGMAYACARLSPVFNAEVKSFDDKPALAIPGVVQIVEIPGGAAVVASNSWAAIKGAEALSISYRKTRHDDLNSHEISRRLHAALNDDDKALIAQEWGDFAATAVSAEKILEAVYEVPYLAHAAMEPWSCTAEFDEQGKLHIWAPSEAQDAFRKKAARTAGLPLRHVRVHSPRLGGAFGRWCDPDGIPGAVHTAKAIKRPVKFFWRREDDIAQGHYRPVQVARLRAALDSKGNLAGLDLRMSGPPLNRWVREGELDVFNAVYRLRKFRYRLDSYRLDWVRVDLPVPTSTWRSIGASQNAYFFECFIDEVAREVGKDPYHLRRELLAHDVRALNVIDVAAEAAGWNEPTPDGVARGMAYFECYGSLCAQVAEVSLRNGKPSVRRVVCVLDCGSVVLPDAVKAQMEGCVIMGLSTALGEQVEIRDGGATNTNFDRYRLMRMAEAPTRIDTIIIESGERIGGVGQTPIAPTAPALANAIFALTGRPVRKLPLA